MLIKLDCVPQSILELLALEVDHCYLQIASGVDQVHFSENIGSFNIGKRETARTMSSCTDQHESRNLEIVRIHFLYQYSSNLKSRVLTTRTSPGESRTVCNSKQNLRIPALCTQGLLCQCQVLTSSELFLC